MAKDEAFDLRGELSRVLNDGQFSSISLTVLSGDKYLIAHADEVVVTASIVLVIPRTGGYSFFPFHTLCNIDVK